MWLAGAAAAGLRAALSAAGARRVRGPTRGALACLLRGAG
jgi:hypothetical protein